MVISSLKVNMPNKMTNHFTYRLGLPTHIYRQVDYFLKTSLDESIKDMNYLKTISKSTCLHQD